MSINFPCGLTQTFSSLDTIKQILGFTETIEHDTILQRLLEQVTSDFQNYFDRWLFINNWTEKFDIETDQEFCIQLKEFPIVSVAGLTDADLAITSDLYDIYAPTGQICLESSYFTQGRQTVETTYRAGYSPECIPPKLAGACEKEVARRFESNQSSPDLVYEKIGDYAYRKDIHEDKASWRTYGFSAEVRRVLDYFRDTG